MKWIPIETKPYQGGVYLASDKEDIAICGYWPHLKPTWGKLETNEPFYPTHWMQLPGVPEDDNKTSL